MAFFNKKASGRFIKKNWRLGMGNKKIFSLDPRTFTDKTFWGYRDPALLIERRIDEKEDGLVPGDLVLSPMVRGGNRKRVPMSVSFQHDPFVDGPSVRTPILPPGHRISGSLGSAFHGIIESVVVPGRDMRHPGKPVPISLVLMNAEPVETRHAYLYFRTGNGVIVESNKIIHDHSVLTTLYRDFHSSAIPKKDFFALPFLPKKEREQYIPKEHRDDWNRGYRPMDPKTRSRLLDQVRRTTACSRSI
ncbi:MAG: hypothetical protein WCL23_01705 [Candidatus Moraniibacteriota bacterium]